MIKEKKKKKIELRFCAKEKFCVYKSYFSNRCMAPKRVIWRTCRFKKKEVNNANE